MFIDKYLHRPSIIPSVSYGNLRFIRSSFGTVVRAEICKPCLSIIIMFKDKTDCIMTFPHYDNPWITCYFGSISWEFDNCTCDLFLFVKFLLFVSSRCNIALPLSYVRRNVWIVIHCSGSGFSSVIQYRYINYNILDQIKSVTEGMYYALLVQFEILYYDLFVIINSVLYCCIYAMFIVFLIFSYYNNALKESILFQMRWCLINFLTFIFAIYSICICCNTV